VAAEALFKRALVTWPNRRLAGVARSLRHGEHDAIFEAVPQPGDAGQGERDFRVVPRH